MLADLVYYPIFDPVNHVLQRNVYTHHRPPKVPTSDANLLCSQSSKLAVPVRSPSSVIADGPNPTITTQTLPATANGAVNRHQLLTLFLLPERGLDIKFGPTSIHSGCHSGQHPQSRAVSGKHDLCLPRATLHRSCPFTSKHALIFSSRHSTVRWTCS
jgi:hypothetical protein